MIEDPIPIVNTRMRLRFASEMISPGVCVEELSLPSVRTMTARHWLTPLLIISVMPAWVPSPFKASRYHSLVIAPESLKRPLVVTARTEEDEIIIDELAGSRAAIAQALPALFKEYDIRRVTINHLGGDAEMAALARHHRWPTETGEFGGTVGIVEPERFWAACEPLFRERLGKGFKCLSFHADDRITIACGEEKLELDGMEELTGLVFLPPHRRDELKTGLPEDSHLRGVLDRLFPLPLVSYGLNYV